MRRDERASKSAIRSTRPRQVCSSSSRTCGLAGSDTKVFIGARDQAAGERAARVLQSEGLDVESVMLDVNDASSVQEAARQIDNDHGRLDILINNAGILPEAVAGETGLLNLELFKETFATNLFGAVTVIEEFLPLSRSSRSSCRCSNGPTTAGSSTCRPPWAR